MIHSVCFTGYRPEKFSFPFDDCDEQYLELRKRLYEEIKNAVNSGYTDFYSGMARGFDIVAAETVLSLKKLFDEPKIKIICVIPFEGFDRTFSRAWKKRYEACIKNADEKIVVSEANTRLAYLRRNDYLLENSDMVITFYDGKSGGTKYTVCKALRTGHTVINLALTTFVS